MPRLSEPHHHSAALKVQLCGQRPIFAFGARCAGTPPARCCSLAPTVTPMETQLWVGGKGCRMHGGPGDSNQDQSLICPLLQLGGRPGQPLALEVLATAQVPHAHASSCHTAWLGQQRRIAPGSLWKLLALKPGQEPLMMCLQHKGNRQVGVGALRGCGGCVCDRLQSGPGQKRCQITVLHAQSAVHACMDTLLPWVCSGPWASSCQGPGASCCNPALAC